jgi:hypothetical protein
MKRSLVFGVAGVIGMVIGLAFLLIPTLGLGAYNVKLDEHTTFVARDYGFTLFMLAAIMWLLRKVDTLKAALRAVITAGFYFMVIGLIVSIWNILAVDVTFMHWVNAVIYLVLGIGFGVLYFKKSE